MARERPLRFAGAALALVAAGIHLALSVAQLIPGEPTPGLLFAAMGAGYLGCAVGLLLQRLEADVIVLLYALALIGAYAASRGDLPVEAIGLTTKAAEAALAVIVGTLVWRNRRAF